MVDLIILMEIGWRFSDSYPIYESNFILIKSINQPKMRNSLRKDKNFVSLIGWKEIDEIWSIRWPSPGLWCGRDFNCWHFSPSSSFHPPPPQFSSVQSQQLELTELLRKKKRKLKYVRQFSDNMLISRNMGLLIFDIPRIKIKIL